MARGQNQRGGEGSTNMLSGRDLTINNYNGLSPAQAVEIAEQVVSRELARFSIEAQQEISRRVEAMRVELIERIGQFDKASLDAFRDPDVQALLGEAQVSYARSGRDDVRRTLVDLVVARCSASPGGLEAIVTAEAIEVVRKVTRGGMAILTVSFLVARVRNMAINNLQDLDNWAARNILPFIDEVPANQAEYLHLVSSGTAQISLGERQIVPLLAETYPGVFQQGISQDEISPLLWELHEQAGNLFMPCLISEGTLQVAALDKEIAAQRIPATASPELREQYQSLLDSNLVPDPEGLICERMPSWWRILKVWEATPLLRKVDLTSVGIAIAHCNWSNQTQEVAPLSIWLDS